MATQWEEVKEPRSKAGFVKRTLGGAASSALEGLKNIVSPAEGEQDFLNFVKNLEAKRGRSFNATRYPNEPSRGVEKLLGATQEELQPQGALESGLQRFLGQAPIAAATGGIAGGLRGALNVLGRTAAGSAAAQGAESAGLPEWAQTAAQLGTELGISGRRHGLVRPNTLKEKSYKAAEESLRPSERGSSKALRTAFDKIDDLRSHETNKKVQEVVRSARDVVAGNIDRYGKIDIKSAWENKKSLNRMRNESSVPRAAIPYIDELSRGLNKVLEDHSPANPSFWKNLSTGDQIHRAQNINSVIGDFIDRNMSTKGRYFKKVVIPLRGVMRVLEGGEKASHYLRMPDIRNYYGKVALAAAKDNLPDVVKYSNKLDRAFNKAEQNQRWEEISPDTESGWEEIA